MANVDYFFCSSLNLMLVAALRISEDQCRLVLTLRTFLVGFLFLQFM